MASLKYCQSPEEPFLLMKMSTLQRAELLMEMSTHSTGAWAASGRVYTKDASAAPGGVYTTGAWAASGGVYVHYKALYCSWKCLRHRSLCCSWRHLHHRDSKGSVSADQRGFDIGRVQSCVLRLPKYWHPTPFFTRRVCTPRNKGGGYTLAGQRGGLGGRSGWGSIFLKTQDIGLVSYSNNLSTVQTHQDAAHAPVV